MRFEKIRAIPRLKRQISISPVQHATPRPELLIKNSYLYDQVQ